MRLSLKLYANSMDVPEVVVDSDKLFDLGLDAASLPLLAKNPQISYQCKSNRRKCGRSLKSGGSCHTTSVLSEEPL